MGLWHRPQCWCWPKITLHYHRCSTNICCMKVWMNEWMTHLTLPWTLMNHCYVNEIWLFFTNTGCTEVVPTKKQLEYISMPAVWSEWICDFVFWGHSTLIQMTVPPCLQTYWPLIVYWYGQLWKMMACIFKAHPAPWPSVVNYAYTRQPIFWIRPSQIDPPNLGSLQCF